MPLKGANSVFLAAQNQKAKLQGGNDVESLDRGSMRLQQLGWVFWEDCTRLSTLCLPRDVHGEGSPKYQLAQHFAKDIRRALHYEVEGLFDQVKGAIITNEDWNNIIVPGLSRSGCPGTSAVSRTSWVDDWYTRQSSGWLPTPFQN